MSITDVESRAAALNAALALIDANSLLKIYAGTVPSTTATDLTAQVLLSEHEMAAVPFATTTNGVATANAIEPATALASGTATFYRLEDSDGIVRRQGSVGMAGSGADLLIDDSAIVAGGNIIISAYTVTQA